MAQRALHAAHRLPGGGGIRRRRAAHTAILCGAVGCGCVYPACHRSAYGYQTVLPSAHAQSPGLATRGVSHAGGHQRYKTLRNIFYTDLSGVIIVHDGVAGRCRPLAFRKALRCLRALVCASSTYMQGTARQFHDRKQRYSSTVMQPVACHVIEHCVKSAAPEHAAGEPGICMRRCCRLARWNSAYQL